jgi:hypothetical protein
MGQYGRIDFFTERTGQRPELLVRGALEIAGVTHVQAVWRSIGEDREWDLFQQVLVDDGAPSEMVGSDVGCEEAIGLYREGTSLCLVLGESAMGLPILEAIRAHVPEEARGNFAPCEPGIKVGAHDVWEAVEHHDGFRFGRAVFSFGLFGYGTPNDWQGFRDLVFETPEVLGLQRRLEALAGPMKRCAYWSV